jgi:acyl-coenzyme A thioesterase PaaI-like protein
MSEVTTEHARPGIRYGGPERLFGVRGLCWEGAEALGTMRMDGWRADAAGRGAEGVLGVLVDDVLGYAAVADPPAGHWSVSTDITLELLDGWAEANTATARARIVEVNDGASTCVCRVTDEQGRLIAIASERGRYVPVDEHALAPDQGEPRPVQGEHDASGILELVETGGTIVVPGTAALQNRLGSLHGGVSLCAAQIAARRALDRAGLESLSPTAVRIVYPKPARGSVELHATLRHAGRSFAVIDVEGRSEDRVVVLAQITAHPIR